MFENTSKVLFYGKKRSFSAVCLWGQQEKELKQGGGGGTDPALEAKADKERAIN